MNNFLAQNIFKNRKLKNYTQEELAKKLNVSFQAVSKWETGQSLPDIEVLADIATVLDTDINSLMGYVFNKKKVTIYEDEYRTDDYYWGVEPSAMCYQVLKKRPATKPLKLLDIGCGEGKDAVFFAKNGYLVTAFDIADAGLEKAKRLADNHNVSVNYIKSNLLDFRLESEFDILFSSGVFNYIPPELRDEILTNFKLNTAEGGLHAFNVFVKKPFIPPAPDHEENSYDWKSGELFTYYSDWLIDSCNEVVFGCNSSGIHHMHCMDEIIAEKV
ncbi:MAG: helix-turn-helix domain-containing protein [Eubacteriales bacterium]